MAHAREAAPQRPAQRQNLGWTQVGEIASFDVAPDLLDGVELGRIGRQAFDVKPASLPRQVPPASGGSVGGQPVPEQDDRPPAEVALERRAERDQAPRRCRCPGRSGSRRGSGGHPSGRPARPRSTGASSCRPVGQDGRLAPRGPRPPDDRVVREAAFVLEDEPGAAAPGVFFTRGHRVRVHCAIAASSRSRAWRTGRCTDQCNARSRYQTCPGESARR